TRAVWSEGSFSDFHEPASPSRLVLFAAPQDRDIVAVYDELSPWHRDPLRKSYFVLQNVDRIEAGRKPAFLGAAATNGLCAIPLCEGVTNATMGMPSALPCAIVYSSAGRFKILNRNEVGPSEFQLPVYASTAGPIKRVLLTPL